MGARPTSTATRRRSSSASASSSGSCAKPPITDSSCFPNRRSRRSVTPSGVSPVQAAAARRKTCRCSSPSLTLLRTQSDDRLVALAREGHERAFEAIVERYRRPLLRAARRVLPEARAEDALQQALLSAWTALQRGDEVRDLRAWLYRIVHNSALNALRVSGYDYDELHDALRITDAPGRRARAPRGRAPDAREPRRRCPTGSARRCCAPRSAATARRRSLATSASPTTRCASSSTARVSPSAPRPPRSTPLPLRQLARRGRLARRPCRRTGSPRLRGAAPAGAAATLAKAGTVAVLAGGAFTGPALVDRLADGPQARCHRLRRREGGVRSVHTSRPRRHGAPAASAGEEAVRRPRPQRGAGRRERDGSGRSTRRTRRPAAVAIPPGRAPATPRTTCAEDRSGRDRRRRAPDEVVAEQRGRLGAGRGFRLALGGRARTAAATPSPRTCPEARATTGRARFGGAVRSQPVEAPAPGGPGPTTSISDSPHGGTDPESGDPGPG